MNPNHPVIRARITQSAAMRALALHGVHHPIAHVLLAASARAAAVAYAAGHGVRDLHPTSKGLSWNPY